MLTLRDMAFLAGLAYLFSPVAVEIDSAVGLAGAIAAVLIGFFQEFIRVDRGK